MTINLIKKYQKPILIALIFLTVFITHLMSSVRTSGDSRWNVATALSIIREGNIDLDEYAERIEKEDNYGVTVVNGHIYNSWPVGTSVLSVPFVFMIDWFLEKSVGLDFEQEAKIRWTIFAEEFIACIFVGLTAIFIYLISYTLTRKIMISLVIVFLFSFCTSAWSTASRALWTHVPSIFLLTVTLYLFVKARSLPAAIRTAGLFLALAFITRPTNIIPASLFFLLILFQYRKFLVINIFSALLVFIPFFMLNFQIYGEILPSYFRVNQVGHAELFWEALLGNLISPARGVLIWSPIFLLCIFGIFLKIKEKNFNKLDGVVLVSIILHWIIISSLPHWWAGFSIGPRYFTDMVPFFIYFLIPVVQYIFKMHVKQPLILIIFILFTGFSFFTHYQGSHAYGANGWNMEPVSVDIDPSRIWDWNDLQFLR